MPAHARIVIPGIAHHVTQRGNYRQDVFNSFCDRELYLRYVVSAAEAYELEIHAWCLMSNHVHWIVLPRNKHAMAQTFRRAHSRYAAYVNGFQKRAHGHLWQGRYHSCALDENHLAAALLYVERNPLRAGMVRSPSDYRWSSAAARLGEVPCPSYLQLYLWSRLFDAESWRDALNAPADMMNEKILRASTQQGKPHGSSEFLRKLSLEHGRDLFLRPIGRPTASTFIAGG